MYVHWEYLIKTNKPNTMQTQIESRLENRRTKVLKLMSLAVMDRQPHKYIQGSFILGEI